jgi:heavy metal translocating P-type ATPase
MVYIMLMEAADSPEPDRFRQTELYRRCVAAGVVPSDTAQLAEMQSRNDTAETASAPALAAGHVLSMQATVVGMWCPACSWVIHTALEHLEGVIEATCDFATDRLNCRYDPTRIDPDAILKSIRQLGYDASRREDLTGNRGHAREFTRLVITALLSVNVMMLSWALYSGFFTSLDADDIYFISIPILVLATVVLVYGGGSLFRKAWTGLRAAAPGMEALVCLGAAGAYGYSLINFWSGSWHLYFDTASMLITLVLLGKLLESRAKRNVRRDLDSFLALQPNKVRICSDRFPAGRFTDIRRLKPGDRFRVKAGEIVPADGRLISGKASVDVSVVTGESRPRSISAGDAVISGTRLLSGDATVRAQRVGADALLGEMIAIIERGLSRQTAVQGRTDRYLALFVPLMVALAAATAVAAYAFGLSVEHSFERGLTVLVIACPCALGIAIPLARIAGLSNAGRNGILVRDIAAFEQIGHIDSLVMDKTGTVTIGQWLLTRVIVHDDLDVELAMALASGLEQSSNHVIARSVLAYARQHGIAPARIDDIKAHADGMSGNHGHQQVKIGTWGFASGDPSADADADGAGSSLSRVFLSLDNRICATLEFSDQLRHSAHSAIRCLKDAGVSLTLVSGDARSTTRALAADLGIEQARGGLLPRDKALFVEQLQARGHRVAMLGDGINDAPALAQADLSIAVHHDAALAQQAAAVTLMRGEPIQLVEFMRLARRVNRTVVQNLTCAWVYNLISIPIAMSGLLNPLVAVSAMLLSSLTVIGNTLRLAGRPARSSNGSTG